MQNPQLQVRINNGAPILSQAIYEMHLKYSLEDILPSGFIAFTDKAGKMLGEYQYEFGAPVSIEIFDTEGKKRDLIMYDENIYHEYKMLIASTTDNAEFDPKVFQGYIQCEIMHPWKLFKYAKNRCYSPMKNHELIKEVVMNSARGGGMDGVFDVDEDKWEKSGDKGNTPRYKCMETDYDFIMNKVLPYTTIGDKAPYFYFNNMGKFCLRSWKKMSSEKPKVVFVPPPESIEPSLLGQIDSACDKNGLNKDHAITYIQKIGVQIYNNEKMDDIIEQMYNYLSFESTETGLFMGQTRKPVEVIIGKQGDNYGNVLPLSLTVEGQVEHTGTTAIRNRTIYDGKSMAFTNSKVLNEVFLLHITTKLSCVTYDVGDTAEVILAQVEYNEKNPLTGKPDTAKFTHWANGKWVVKEIEYIFKDRNLYAETTLMRPTFQVNAKNTSLSNWEKMSQIVPVGR